LHPRRHIAAKFTQNILRHTHGLEYLINLTSRILPYHDNPAFENQIRKVFKRIFGVLAQSCRDNTENKKWIFDRHFEFLLTTLEQDRYSIDMCVFMHEFIHDNTALIGCTKSCSALLNKLLKQMELLHHDQHKQAFYLSLIQKLIFVKDHSVQVNQRMIISKLINKEQKALFGNMLLGDNFINYLKETGSNAFCRTFKGVDKEIRQMSGKMSFHLAFLEILTYCSYDRNAFADKICQQ
jgi:hypothetical protein